MSEVSEVSAVSEVSEVSVSTTPSPFPTSSVINFSELAKEQLSRPDILRLKVSPTLRLATVPVQDGSLLLPTQFQAQDPPTDLFYENLKNSMSGFQPVPPRHNISAWTCCSSSSTLRSSSQGFIPLP